MFIRFITFFMIRRLFFGLFLAVLAVVLYFNPNFKTIAAGVAILLFGMIMLEEGFKVFTKGPLQNLLKNATDKLYKSITVGATVTALIQSSSLVSVITISFISAGLISLSGGLGLIFGANIGTTATAWLVAGFGLKIKISALAMPMLVFGIIFSFQKTKALKGIGNVLAGLGFFFLGIHYMKEGFDVFKEYIDLTQFAVSGYLGVIIYTGVGIVITTILQSSSATLALILTALAAGQLEYENALALAIGANVGTTITAVLGSLSSNIAGKRLAMAHLIFNLVTGIVALAIIFPLANLVDYLANVVGISPNDYTLKLAIFHTIFNVLGVLLMIPFISKLEAFLIRFLKDKDVATISISTPKYLNETIMNFPGTAIYSLFKESRYLFKNAIFEIVAHGLNIHREDIKSEQKIKKIIKKSTEDMEVDVEELYYVKVKTIYGEILKYATTAQSELKLTKKQHKAVNEIKVANRKMVEIIKDVRELHKNVTLARNLNNPYLMKEYNSFRKKITKVLRVIYLFKEDSEKYANQLGRLKVVAKENVRKSNKSIDKLIRKDLISVEMASSLFNDYSNVNDISKKLIEVAELLYGNKDSLFENGNSKNKKEV